MDNFKIKMPPVEKTLSNRWIWEGLGHFLQILFYGLLLAIVIYMMYWLWKKISTRKPSKTGFIVSQAERQEAKIQYLQQAEQAAQSQDYRLAIHNIFMAAVTQTIRDTHFHKAEFLTNRELANVMDFSGFRSPEQLSRLLNEMLQTDEPRWFGTEEADLTHYNAIRAIHANFSNELTVKSFNQSKPLTEGRRYA